MANDPVATLLIRADASPEVGLGHVMRCGCLQVALQPLGIACYFAFRHMPESLQQRILEQGGQLVPLNTADLKNDAEITLHLARTLGAKAILLDGYQFDSAYQRRLFRQGPSLVLMDDINNRGRIYADLLINSLPHANQLSYAETAPEARSLLGLEYVLLRDEFRQLQAFATRSSERSRLLVNFGGSDILGLSLPVIRDLLKQDPHLPITLITGSGFSRSEDVEELLCLYPQLEHFHNCQEMARQFGRAGLALAAPGATIYELAALGVTSVFLICAENQELSAIAHESFGWCRTFDARCKNQYTKALQKTIELWGNPDQRDVMQEKARGLIDGLGMQRVAQEILYLIKNIEIIK